jgi:hypothetical protein
MTEPVHQHARAVESGERAATMILSRSAHVSLTIGFFITIAIGIAGCAVWMTRIADDVGSIRVDLRAMAAQMEKISTDHELRLRELEKHKP